jgi:hypothetical protein
MSEATDELAGRIGLARDRMAVKVRQVAGESGRLVEALAQERDKSKRAALKVRELRVALKNGEVM